MHAAIASRVVQDYAAAHADIEKAKTCAATAARIKDEAKLAAQKAVAERIRLEHHPYLPKGVSFSDEDQRWVRSVL